MSIIKPLVDAFNADIDVDQIDYNLKDDGSFRFELYGAGISICSQKVRCVILEKHASVRSHEMNPRPDTFPMNYLPSYVTMRMSGIDPDTKLVDRFSGGSSVDLDGFDPLAVPTLADHEADKIVVDSRVICAYLDRVLDGIDLVPDDIRAEVERHVKIVDKIPNVTLLYGDESGIDRRPAAIKAFSGPPLELKLKLLNDKINENPGNTLLERAYNSKIIKEKAIIEVRKKNSNLSDTFAYIQEMLGGLEGDLSRSNGPWLFGDRFTMADLFWGINLHRLENVGHGQDMGALTKAYTQRLYDRPSISAGLIEYPNSWWYAPEYFDEKMLARHQGSKTKTSS